MSQFPVHNVDGFIALQGCLNILLSILKLLTRLQCDFKLFRLPVGDCKSKE